eukprot:scaffold119126_cov31-Tisochrysis_lutea.AAC.1
MSIPNNCFANCGALVSISAPGVWDIGERAFWGCTSLQQIPYSLSLSRQWATCASTSALPLRACVY